MCRVPPHQNVLGSPLSLSASAIRIVFPPGRGDACGVGVTRHAEQTKKGYAKRTLLNPPD